MEKDSKYKKDVLVIEELPFVLNNLVRYEGATDPTTSGTWDDMDSADAA